MHESRRSVAPTVGWLGQDSESFPELQRGGREEHSQEEQEHVQRP